MTLASWSERLERLAEHSAKGVTIQSDTIRAMLAVIRAAEVHLTANFGPNSNELMDALAKLRECVGG